MSLQFKWPLTLLILFLYAPAMHCQESSDSLLADKLDSLLEQFEARYDAKLNQHQRLFRQEIYRKQQHIDSLYGILEAQESELHKLELYDNDLTTRIEESEVEIRINSQIITEEKDKFRRILGITGPSILFLIFASVLIYFLLMMKQQEQTDRKINALKKYTHTEIEESRTDLMKKVKKRIKKVSESLAVRSEKRNKINKEKKTKGKKEKK